MLLENRISVKGEEHKRRERAEKGKAERSKENYMIR
jgi:hypothetical protein